MNTCTIIGVIVHCLLTGPKPTAAQAAATLQAAAPAYPTGPAAGYVPPQGNLGPAVAIAGGTGQAGPFTWPAPQQFYHYNDRPWVMCYHNGLPCDVWAAGRPYEQAHHGHPQGRPVSDSKQRR